MLCEHAGVLGIFPVLFLFFIIIFSLSSIVSAQHCSPPNPLPTHVTAIKLKQTGGFRQNNLHGVANQKIPPSFNENPQKTRCTLTECISSDKYKCVSSLYVSIFFT